MIIIKGTSLNKSKLWKSLAEKNYPLYKKKQKTNKNVDCVLFPPISRQPMKLSRPPCYDPNPICWCWWWLLCFDDDAALCFPSSFAMLCLSSILTVFSWYYFVYMLFGLYIIALVLRFWANLNVFLQINLVFALPTANNFGLNLISASRPWQLHLA